MLTDRRRHERFSLRPMYTSLGVRLLDREGFDHEGHAYDISEGGIRFELDRPLEPGTRVAMRIELPNLGADRGPGRAIFVFATVVWLGDEDEPGPARMAAVFNDFAREGDRERLLRQLATGVFARAA